MKLIIDIPEDVIESAKSSPNYYPTYHFQIIWRAIANGIPLDKIKAEIEQNAYPIVHGVNNHEKGMTLYGILQVIDKYKAGSGDKE